MGQETAKDSADKPHVSAGPVVLTVPMIAEERRNLFCEHPVVGAVFVVDQHDSLDGRVVSAKELEAFPHELEFFRQPLRVGQHAGAARDNEGDKLAFR